jgi:hypothetical protein
LSHHRTGVKKEKRNRFVAVLIPESCCAVKFSEYDCKKLAQLAPAEDKRSQDARAEKNQAFFYSAS